MTTIARLNIEVTADIKLLEKEFLKAQSTIDKSTSKIKTSFKKAENQINSSSKNIQFNKLKKEFPKIYEDQLFDFPDDSMFR